MAKSPGLAYDNFHSLPILLPPWVDYGNYRMVGNLAIFFLLTYKKFFAFFGRGRTRTRIAESGAERSTTELSFRCWNTNIS